MSNEENIHLTIDNEINCGYNHLINISKDIATALVFIVKHKVLFEDEILFQNIFQVIKLFFIFYFVFKIQIFFRCQMENGFYLFKILFSFPMKERKL